MVNISFIFLILYSIKISLTFVPNWNLEGSSIDLLKSGTYEKIIFEGKMNNINIQFKKVFIKEENTVLQNNYLIIEGGSAKKVNWDNIENIYKINGNYYICPKGREYLYKYNENEPEKSVKMNPKEFDKNINWELKCYYQPDNKWLFTAFLNSNGISKIYAIQLDSNKWSSQPIADGAFDFIWTQTPVSNNDFIMSGIFLSESKFVLKKIKITIDGKEQFTTNSIYTRELNIISENSYGYINEKNNYFYAMFYNNSNQFMSKYSNTALDVEDKNNLNKINVETNNETPFRFINNVTIEELKFIRNTKYAYYKVNDNSDKQTYHGVIDIELNKIIFNTNEEIDEFKPLTSHSMLAIIGNSAYEVCLIKDSWKCIEECPSDKKLFLDTEYYNVCNDESFSCLKSILIPENICIASCDENYLLLDNNKCGLCKDLNSDNPFKLINTKGCLPTKPEGTYYINENFQIINNCSDNCRNCTKLEKCDLCIEEYIMNSDGICRKCHHHCASCTDDEYTDSNQKCTSCKNNELFLKDGNCVEKCGDGYFIIEGENSENNNKKCKKCFENCKTCYGEYEEDTDNEKCLSCYDDSRFKYLVDEKNFSSNCVEECPNGTQLINNICKSKEEGEEENDYMIWVFIILIIILLIIIILFYLKSYSRRSKRNSEEILLNELNELTQ